MRIAEHTSPYPGHILSTDSTDDSEQALITYGVQLIGGRFQSNIGHGNVDV